jgi:hypothetical protein
VGATGCVVIVEAVISAAGGAGVTPAAPTVHSRVCTKRGPSYPESVALLPVEGLRTQSIPSGPTGSRTSTRTTVPAGRASGSRSRLPPVPSTVPPARQVTWSWWYRGWPVSTHSTPSAGTVPSGVCRTVICPALRRPVMRATMCSRPTWSQSKPIHRIMECSLGRRCPQGNVPPPSCSPSGPPEMLSSPTQRHHLCWSATSRSVLV